MDIMYSTPVSPHRPVSDAHLCSGVSSKTHSPFYENWLKKLLGLGHVKLAVLHSLTVNHKTSEELKRVSESPAKQGRSVHELRTYLHFSDNYQFDRLVEQLQNNFYNSFSKSDKNLVSPPLLPVLCRTIAYTSISPHFLQRAYIK